MSTHLKSAGLVLFVAVLLGVSGCSSQPSEPIRQSDPNVDTPSEVTEAPETPAPTSPSGILAVASTVDGFTLALIDPGTGSSRTWREFGPVGEAIPWVSRYGTALTTRRSFTPNYDRVAAKRRVSGDGSEHVGWITSDGKYVDVTDAIAPAQSDFSDAARHLCPRFGSDGMFYFVDANAGEIMKVDPNNLSASAVVRVADSGSYNYFELYPNGTVEAVQEVAYRPLHVENTTSGVFGVGRVEDWLDANTMLATSLHPVENPFAFLKPSYIYTCSAYTDESQRSSPQDGSDREVQAITPVSSKRTNWNPLASPDGQQVAFLSMANPSVTPELFTVSRNGGDPVKLATDHVFFWSEGSGYGVQLLAWLP